VSEILLGDVVARLRADNSQFTQAMTDAAQRLNALNQALTQTRTQSATTQQSTQQVAQAFQALNQSIQQQTQAYTQAQGATQQYRQAQLQLLDAIRQQRQEQEQATQATQAHGTALRAVFSIAGGIGLATSIGAIVGQMKELATSIITVGVQFQQLRQQFTATQGVSGGAANFQQMIGLAQRLGVELVPLAEGFRRFDAATRGTAIQGDQAARIFENMVTGMRALGASSQQTERGLLALQQMVSKGVVSQEELRQQLAEAIPGATQIAARAFGVTTQELNKMIEKGQDSIEFVRRFSDQFRTDFGGNVATATNTVAAAFERFTNELKLAGAAAASSGLLDMVRKLADAATSLLESFRKVREERERALGGPAPAIPASLQGLSPALQGRQQEIEDLRQQVTDLRAQAPRLRQRGADPDTMMAELQTQLQALQAEQRRAIVSLEQRLLAEGAGPGSTGPSPMDATEDRMAQIIEKGRQELRDIDLNAPFLDALELADQKFKSWEKTLKAVQDEFGKLGEGLRRTITPSGAPNSLDALIERIAGEKGLDPNLMRALVQQESNFDPRAVSRAGARGLMQLMPGTAAAYGAGGREFDPETNLRAGMSYFAELLQKFNGNVERALTAYNAGPARGGIPLPTGENATFAQDVLRRIPQTVQGMLDAAGRTQRALEAGKEAQTPDRERLAQTRATGREVLQAIDEEERQQDAAARERRQQAMATGREYLRALDEEMRKRDQAVESLKTLERQYSLTADARQEDVAARLAAQFPQDEEIQTRAANVKLLIEEKQAMESSFAAIKARTDAQREAQAAAEGMTQNIEGTLERLRAPREERAELRLRAQARRQNIELTPEDEARLRAITEQERLNEAMELTRRAGEAVSQSLTDGLLSLADGTQNVSQAFERMAKSIIESLARIAISAGFQALLKIGLTALGGALAPTTTTTTTTIPSGPYYQGVAGAQSGAVINKPTLMMVGEGAYNPEVILNRPQLNSLIQSAMQAGPSAGGQAAGGAGISIINVASKEQAEKTAAQERSLGRSVVINYVLDELAQGSGSRIGQVLRNGQR